MLRRKIKDGYSLIEILLYMALLGIFLSGLSQLFVSSLNVNLESEANSSVEQDARYLLLKFRYSLSQASSVNIPASPGASGNTLQIVDSGTTYTFTLNGDNLVVNDGINDIQLNSNRTKVSSLSFVRLGNVGGKNTVSISYTLDSLVQDAAGPQVRIYEYAYGIR